MNNKSKFKKLQLPKSSRHKTNSQISNFFSTSQNEGCSSALLTGLTETTNLCQLENSISSCTSEDIILIVSDDEEYTSQSNKQTLDSKLSINENLPNVVLKHEDKFNQLPRKTVISKFFDNTNVDDNDFENPPMKKKSNKVTKLKSIPKTKKKKQTTIKNAFRKNEEIFSELMAQHSIADDINPDDLQMALAMSMSEATANGISDDDDSKESLACCSGNSNKIRDRLQAFGFKTSSNSGDYDIAYFLPGKKKTKWANKFTSLTLRNSEKQKQKLDHKIEKFLDQQDILKDKSNSINKLNEQYLISSNYLNKFKSEKATIKVHFENYDNDCIEKFYVKELFEPSAVKAGHLMKDLSDIPGRDFSPKEKKKKERTIENPGICEKQSEICKLNSIRKNEKLNSALDSNVTHSKLIEIENFFHKMPHSLCGISLEIQDDILLSPLHKKAKIENLAQSYNNPENEVIVDRLSSPDLFADYENDTLTEKSSNDNDNEATYKSKNNSLNLETNSNIKIFENFSSDEVKIGHEVEKPNIETTFNKSIDHSNNTSIINISKTTSIIGDELIDLTQNIENNNDSNSFLYNAQLSSQNFEKDDNSSQSQLDCTNDDSLNDCIILSNDEGNYSIKIANNTINCNNNIDLTLSSNSDAEEEKYNSIITENNDENNMNNFSLINLIHFDLKATKNLSINENFNLEDNKNISYLDILEENENCEISPLQSPLKSQISLYERNSTNTTPNKVSDENFGKFLSPTKITPPKFCRHQSRFSKYLSASKSTITTNSSRKINMAEEKNSLCNYSESDNEDDEMSFNLTKLRAKFGIKDNNKIKSVHCRKTLSESFITPTKSHNGDDLKFKRFSSSTKFKEFIEKDEGNVSEIDEIDILVHGNEFKTSIFNKPKGIDKLLTADIKTKPTKSTECVINSDINFNEEPKEISSNGRIYLISTQNIPVKPDYKRMDSPTRLKELYKYGLKPLKKKQAVIMLEYIYNQTHPIIVNNNSQENLDSFTQENCELIKKQNNIIFEIENNNKIAADHKYDNFKLSDCCGTKLLEDDGFIFGENINEIYIFQTNMSKKISTALLPLHVAWYNLIKSNYNLKESILHYEPIDLQEIYLFLKRIGYRYDPKDIKKFFDYHCIIFRYDVQDRNTNRHIKKKKSFTTSQKNEQLRFDWML